MSELKREDLIKNYEAAVKKYRESQKLTHPMGGSCPIGNKKEPDNIKKKEVKTDIPEFKEPTPEEIAELNRIENERIEHDKIERLKRRIEAHKRKGGKFLDDFKAPTEALKKALKQVDAFGQSESKYMLLYGRTGCGKTHLVSGYSFKYRTFIVDADQLYPLYMEYKFPDLPVNEDVLPKLTFKKLKTMNIIIDDLGSEVVNEKGYVIECLKHIIDKFQRKIIITTNLSIADLVKRYGDKVFSRFADGCTMVDMSKVKDYRFREYGVGSVSEFVKASMDTGGRNE
jgi:DNA replication protein DnaC